MQVVEQLARAFLSIMLICFTKSFFNRIICLSHNFCNIYEIFATLFKQFSILVSQNVDFFDLLVDLIYNLLKMYLVNSLYDK